MNRSILKKARFAAIVAAALLFASSAAASSFQVLHSFSGPEGETPAAPLVQGTDGFFYGVAAHGGNFAVLPPYGAGTVFRMDANGTVQTLHVFGGPEGAWPQSLIQARDGFFYGTAGLGGQPAITNLNPGVGTIFRMDASGAVTLLYVFPHSIGAGSSQPGPIVQGEDGALYGGALGAFGTNAVGGYIYRFDPITGDFRHLHDFVGNDGAIPTGPLFQADDGFFYGTTNQGGLWNAGVIFKVDVLGNYVLLHSLSILYPGEGSEPRGGVIQASDGFFYGTTELGGYGGEIFRIDSVGNFTVLHRFDSYFSDGGLPVSGLIEGRDGFLYGTAPRGGQPVTDPNRHGVVYRMDKGGAVTVVHTFTGPDGYEPWAALAQAADGRLYGSTVIGGAFGLGVLFRIDTASPPPPPPPTTVTLRSTAINLSATLHKGLVNVSGTVSVRSSTGAAIGGAATTVTWTLPGGATQSQTAITGSNGNANFSAAGGRGKYTLTITNITKTGYTFDRANSVLTKSITK